MDRPEDDRGKLPSPAEGESASPGETSRGDVRAEVEALVEARLDDAVERLRAQNKAYLQTLAAGSTRRWQFLAVLLLFAGSAGWVFTLKQVFLDDPRRAREWIDHELGERMEKEGLREVVQDTVRARVGEFVDQKLVPLEARIDDTVRKLMEAPGHASAAHWDLSGRYVTDSLSTAGPAFGWLDGHGEILKGNRVRVNCGLGDISHFREVAAKFPYYPFPYWAVAVCLKEKGDPSWVEYAEKGRDHERRIVQIPSHDESHDVILAQLEEMLAGQAPAPPPPDDGD